jgi:catechol 2,3-dioxygenase-like lactoylglutathione lyase family enzyme
MNNTIKTKAVHHLTLTVSDLQRSCEFYSSLLGFQVAVDMGYRYIMSNGKALLAITLPSDTKQAHNDDAFSENRIGLDHVSFSVDSRPELEDAVALMDQKGVSHGEIRDLGADLGIYVLAFRDPDHIQLELTAPYAS